MIHVTVLTQVRKPKASSNLLLPSILMPIGRQTRSSRATCQELQSREATVKSVNKSLSIKDSDTIQPYVKAAAAVSINIAPVTTSLLTKPKVAPLVSNAACTTTKNWQTNWHCLIGMLFC